MVPPSLPSGGGESPAALSPHPSQDALPKRDGRGPGGPRPLLPGLPLDARVCLSPGLTLCSSVVLGLTEDKRDHQHPREPGVNLRGLLSVELLTCWAFSQLPSVLSVETPKNAAPPSSTRNPPMQLRVTGTPPPGLLPPPSPHLSTHCAGLSRAEANTGPQRGPHSHPWITGAGRELPWLSLGFPRVQTLEMLRPASPMTLSSVLQNCRHWC